MRGAALVRSACTRHLALAARTAIVAVLLLAGTAASACRRDRAAEGERTAAPAAAAEADGTGDSRSTAVARDQPRRRVTTEQRNAALRAARVWRHPVDPISEADFTRNPTGAGAFGTDEVVDCRLVVKAMGGTTPKFDCALRGQDVIRVKYGRGNPELHAEVAATRLLSALGFGADRMFVVRKVRCAGCSAHPFPALKCLGDSNDAEACFAGQLDYGKTQEFEYAVVERRLDGRAIEATADQGWAFYELDQIDGNGGGSPAAHVHALKLMAVLLAHWDNKAENQRLICLPGGDLPDGSCSDPLALLQDLGATFGPLKLDLPNWRNRPVWADARACRVTMKDLPWSGATFPDTQISEEGRQFLLSLLDQLSPQQIQALFAGARVQLSEAVLAEGRQPEAWAAAFQDKVRQIRQAGPCPQ